MAARFHPKCVAPAPKPEPAAVLERESDQAEFAPATLPGPDVWLTKDGRELTIGEMYRPHLGNAQAVISKWLKREKDPIKRRELKSWRSRMRRELVKREKAWQKKRKLEAEEAA